MSIQYTGITVHQVRGSMVSHQIQFFPIFFRVWTFNRGQRGCWLARRSILSHSIRSEIAAWHTAHILSTHHDGIAQKISCPAGKTNTGEQRKKRTSKSVKSRKLKPLWILDAQIIWFWCAWLFTFHTVWIRRPLAALRGSAPRSLHPSCYY